MSPLVRRYLKTAVAFLVVGLALGIVMIVRRELYGVWPNPWWVSAHTHAILVGFVMMMIMGVALWMFPRPAKEDRRFDPRRAEIAYWLLALGTAARVGGEIARPTGGGGTLAWIIALGGTAQAIGIGVFFWTMWGRIRGRAEEIGRAS